MLLAELSREKLRARRDLALYFGDRRSETYGGLVKRSLIATRPGKPSATGGRPTAPDLRPDVPVGCGKATIALQAMPTQR